MEENTINWEKEISEQVGFTIKLYRIKSKLKQKELAKLSGISRVTLNRIENGKGFPIASIINICKILRVRPTLLLTEALINLENDTDILTKIATIALNHTK